MASVACGEEDNSTSEDELFLERARGDYGCRKREEINDSKVARKILFPKTRGIKRVFSSEYVSRVTKIDLSCYNSPLLSGNIPSQISNLKYLEDLHLSCNKLTGVPPEIGLLRQLKRLELAFNKLTTIPPEIGSLVKLEVLNLSKNKLTTIPPEIGLLLQLEQLNLDHNKLTTIPLEIGSLVKLEVLDLSYNKMEGGIPTLFGALSELRQFNVSRNRLAGALPQDCSKWTKLRALRVFDKFVYEIAEDNQLTVWLRPVDLSTFSLDSRFTDILPFIRKEGDGIEFPLTTTEDLYSSKLGMMLGIAHVSRKASFFPLLFGVLLTYADIVSDFLVLSEFWSNGDWGWFLMGLLFILLPMLFSWVFLYGGKSKWKLGLTLLQLNVVVEMYESLRWGTLRMSLIAAKAVETFMEAAPQSFLQMYVLFREWDDGNDNLDAWKLILSICISVFSMAYTATTSMHDDEILEAISPNADPLNTWRVEAILSMDIATFLRLEIWAYTVSCIGFRLLTTALMASKLRYWAILALLGVLFIRMVIYDVLRPKYDTQSFYSGIVALLFDTVWEYHPRFIAASCFSVAEGIIFTGIWMQYDTDLPVNALLVVLVVLLLIRAALHYPMERLLYPSEGLKTKRMAVAQLRKLEVALENEKWEAEAARLKAEAARRRASGSRFLCWRRKGKRVPPPIVESEPVVVEVEEEAVNSV